MYLVLSGPLGMRLGRDLEGLRFYISWSCVNHEIMSCRVHHRYVSIKCHFKDIDLCVRMRLIALVSIKYFKLQWERQNG